MKIGIYVESNETVGLMYKSYKEIPKIVKKFMDFVDNTVDYAQDLGVPKEDISPKLKEFKEDIRNKLIKPEEVEVPVKSSIIEGIKSTNIEVKKLLDELGDIRKKFRFGDNLIHGIINKPKIYQNSIDENKLSSVNKYMNQASNALDWIEKVIYDIMNMCTNDMNAITVMGKVYFRECHDTSDFMEEFEDEDVDILNMYI